MVVPVETEIPSTRYDSDRGPVEYVACAFSVAAFTKADEPGNTRGRGSIRCRIQRSSPRSLREREAANGVGDLKKMTVRPDHEPSAAMREFPRVARDTVTRRSHQRGGRLRLHLFVRELEPSLRKKAMNFPHRTPSRFNKYHAEKGTGQ
jgi:hypothetical protein